MRWLPFQLNPDIPEAGIPREEYVARKFGARGKGVNERVVMTGRQVGIEFEELCWRILETSLDRDGGARK